MREGLCCLIRSLVRKGGEVHQWKAACKRAAEEFAELEDEALAFRTGFTFVEEDLLIDQELLKRESEQRCRNPYGLEK